MHIFEVIDDIGRNYIDGIKIRRKSWVTKDLYTRYDVTTDLWYDNKQAGSCKYTFQYLSSTDDWVLYAGEEITLYRYLYKTETKYNVSYSETNWTSLDATSVKLPANTLLVKQIETKKIFI